MKSDKQLQKPAESPADVPEWVQKMHHYYSENGFYRPKDLHRVLGDSVDGASAPATIDTSFAGKPAYRR